MKLCTILSSLIVALLTLGTQTAADTVEEAYHAVKLLKGACSDGKAKLGAINRGSVEGGGRIIFGCLNNLNKALHLVQTRISDTEPFPPEVEVEIEAGIKTSMDCLNEILSVEIPRLLTIPEIKRESYEFLREFNTLVNQEEVSIWTDAVDVGGYVFGGISHLVGK